MCHYMNDPGGNMHIKITCTTVSQFVTYIMSGMEHTVTRPVWIGIAGSKYVLKAGFVHDV